MLLERLDDLGGEHLDPLVVVLDVAGELANAMAAVRLVSQSACAAPPGRSGSHLRIRFARALPTALVGGSASADTHPDQAGDRLAHPLGLVLTRGVVPGSL